MGPRPVGRGNVDLFRAFRQMQICFNGATSCRTWKHELETIDPGSEVQLQWGHVLSDVETLGKSPQIRGLLELQWGHVLSDVETRLARLP